MLAADPPAPPAPPAADPPELPAPGGDHEESFKNSRIAVVASSCTFGGIEETAALDVCVALKTASALADANSESIFALAASASAAAAAAAAAAFSALITCGGL